MKILNLRRSAARRLIEQAYRLDPLTFRPSIRGVGKVVDDQTVLQFIPLDAGPGNYMVSGVAIRRDESGPRLYQATWHVSVSETRLDQPL